MQKDSITGRRRLFVPLAAAACAAALWLALAPAAACGGTPGTSARKPAAGPLRVSRENPRYFADPQGNIVYLAGFHDGWELQDYAWGDNNRGVRFDWSGFLDAVTAAGCNVLRLWCVEHTKIVDKDPDLTAPMPYIRAGGGGNAADGGGRFDLERFDPAYFTRLRSRVEEAGKRGLYVIVMLFQGWSIEDKGGRVNPWPYHPFHRGNNTGGIDGDIDGDGEGRELHTWLGEKHPITKLQEAYVRKVIETVNDLDNVLYEIANESHNESLEWQRRMVSTIRRIERSLPKQHPAGITVTFGRPRRSGLNRALLESNADWISPNREAARPYNYRSNPPPTTGRKVILSDTDHLFGVGCKDPAWVWKSFCRGANLLYMDMWTIERNAPGRKLVRRTLGDTVRFSRRFDLRRAAPRGSLASTGCCLAEPGRRYLVYLPARKPVTVDLTGASGKFTVEWLDPQTGRRSRGDPVAGGARRTLRPPFKIDAVLFLERDSTVH